ncbi:hypothetical protein BGZ95_010336 [Linnemannia exigua]|uniref:Uncharacterized protein n=1 Tax=Linnemannia exigua TaxID=604196 RepID=A0AAD4H6F0_9FUNG|nr:hypothetical protein BGZ95_010336 [Linnemannia exigua]
MVNKVTHPVVAPIENLATKLTGLNEKQTVAAVTVALIDLQDKIGKVLQVIQSQHPTVHFPSSDNSSSQGTHSQNKAVAGAQNTVADSRPFVLTAESLDQLLEPRKSLLTRQASVSSQSSSLQVTRSPPLKAQGTPQPTLSNVNNYLSQPQQQQPPAQPWSPPSVPVPNGVAQTISTSDPSQQQQQQHQIQQQPQQQQQQVPQQLQINHLRQQVQGYIAQSQSQPQPQQQVQPQSQPQAQQQQQHFQQQQQSYPPYVPQQQPQQQQQQPQQQQPQQQQPQQQQPQQQQQQVPQQLPQNQLQGQQGPGQQQAQVGPYGQQQVPVQQQQQQLPQQPQQPQQQQQQRSLQQQQQQQQPGYSQPSYAPSPFIPHQQQQQYNNQGQYSPATPHGAPFGRSNSVYQAQTQQGGPRQPMPQQQQQQQLPNVPMNQAY